MADSLADRQTLFAVAGPNRATTLAPDDATRRALTRWHRVHGPLYRVPAARGDGAPAWVVHAPDAVQRVLVRNSGNYTKGAGLDRVKLLLGNGIMVSEGDFWARQRRLLAPAFRPRALADINAMIVAENLALAERLREPAAAGQTVDIAALASELTLVIVLKSIFGADYPRLVIDQANAFSLLCEQPGRDLRFAARFHRLTRVVDAIVAARLAAARREYDFLGHMLAARGRDGGAMPRRALIDEVMTLVVAGHETTASVLAWAWYLLGAHPDVCGDAQISTDRVDDPAVSASGTDSDPAIASIDRIIFETLRLYPPGWLLSRRAIGADTIGGYAIAPGAQLFISPYVLHRHAGYWRAPEAFDPARFARGEPAHRFAYVPFAAGPRRCIGERMALTELRVNLVTLLRRFTPVYARRAPPAIESRVNLRPRDGVRLHWVGR